MRHRWGSAFALAAVVLALTSCAARPPVPSGSLPPSVEVQGRSVPYAGLQAWSVASTTSRTSTRLHVFATGSDDGGSACGPPVVRVHAVETASSVRLSVADYEDPATAGMACPAIGYVPSPQAIDLQRPVGDRTVVDASSGKRGTLLVASDYPTVEAPAPLAPVPLRRDDGSAAITEVWSDGTGTPLSLVTSTPSAVRDEAPYGRIVRQFDIGGTPAVLYSTGSGTDQQQQVQWTPNRRQTITLRLSNDEHRRWTADQAVALARSVTNYTTEATGRLPQPSTPGTAAASYNSADGPVRHAPNLLKSSGVYVGVNCEGKGTVTVSLRGTAYPFMCGVALSHHVVESTGKPEETFYVDVTATTGVRWAVTLARASLDGS